MKQELITLRGKLVLDDEKIVIKNFKLKENRDLYWGIAWTALFLNFYSYGKKIQPLVIVLLVLIGFFWLFFFIDLFFFTCLKNTISLNRIKSYKVETDDHGLETRVVLYLKSGRRKEIIFRTHEKQHEIFLEHLTRFIVQPLVA
jgi:sensor histidine kinase YesM